MIALTKEFKSKTTTTVAALSVVAGLLGAAVVGTGISRLSGPTQSVPDVSGLDICTPDRLCDGFQMKAAMRQDGELSLTSPVGKTLATIGAQGNVPQATILDLMGQFDKNLHTTKNYASVVEVDGMAIIRPPQFKLNPALPFNAATNPYGKANYDTVVMISRDDKCESYTIRPDGSFKKADDLQRRVSSHGGITSEECAEKRKRFVSQMEGLNV